jgi:hypothetical protein
VDMRTLGFESGAASTVLAVGAVIVLLLAFIVAAARRRNDYAAAAVALIAVAYGGVALASFVAVRYFANVLVEMAEHGGGIASISLGMGEAAQLPLSAAWIAAVATVVAMLFAFPAMWRTPGLSSDARPGRLFWTAGLALAGGVASVLLFRGAMAFVLKAITPGAQPPGMNATNMPELVNNRLTMTSAGIAVCFAIVIVTMLLMFRPVRPATPSRASLRLVAVALVVSLGVSTTLVVGLRSYSSRSLSFALNGGPVSQLPDLPQ